jgi:uncharacterized protein (TIGR03435 family)
LDGVGEVGHHGQIAGRVGPKQIPEMLQTLLRDRFQMKMHRDAKEFPVYGLIVGKGELKLKEPPADPAAEGGQPPTRSVNVAASGSSAGPPSPTATVLTSRLATTSSWARNYQWRSSRIPWRGLRIGQ